jgi:hypothetical protein
MKIMKSKEQQHPTGESSSKIHLPGSKICPGNPAAFTSPPAAG